MSSISSRQRLWKATSSTPSALMSARLARQAKPPSKHTWRAGLPYRAFCRCTIRTASVESAGLPCSTTASVTRAEAPLLRESLWP